MKTSVSMFITFTWCGGDGEADGDIWCNIGERIAFIGPYGSKRFAAHLRQNSMLLVLFNRAALLATGSWHL